MTQPRLLVISALDPSAGAGMLMDLKAGCAAGAQVVAAITAITVQGPKGIRAVHPVDSDLLAAQLETLADELPLGAVKIGALASEDNVNEVARFLRKVPQLPVLLDPVIKPSRGVQLLPSGAITALTRKLLPVATVVTPNRHEAVELTGIEVSDEKSMVAAGRALVRLMRGGDDGWALIKGGHLDGPPVDVLVGRDIIRRYRGKRRPGEFRGTGCALASAVAAKMSLGMEVPEAVARARRMLIRWMDKAAIIPGKPTCLHP